MQMLTHTPLMAQLGLQSTLMDPATVFYPGQTFLFKKTARSLRAETVSPVSCAGLGQSPVGNRISHRYFL